jgi:hypothetical protein
MCSKNPNLMNKNHVVPTRWHQASCDVAGIDEDGVKDARQFQGRASSINFLE